MPVIKQLENKIRLVTIVCTVFIIGCVVISVGALLTARLMVSDAHKKVYVIDDNVPIPVHQVDDKETMSVEAKSVIAKFHEYFFTLSPDEKYIDYTVKKALYLIDNTGKTQYNVLREQGFYDNIVQTNTHCTLFIDSIHFNPDSMSFVFYGRQRLERSSATIYRELRTAGYIQKLPGRSENNPFGMSIVNWRTISNRDIDGEQ
jgi:conjugative transposon TraK protein